MSSFKEKTQVFIIGILIGLVVAGGFFILKLDDYFKELNFYKTLSKTFTSEKKSEDSFVKNEGTFPANENPSVSNVQKKSKAEQREVVSKDAPVMDLDTLKTNGTKDSIIGNLSSEDEIVVRKDELLSTKTIEVLNLDPIAKMNAKDSLLQKVSGMKDDRSYSKQFFNIEFWSSPLNYKGYKLGKYKLVLYGIPSAEALKLYKLEDVIYLISGSIIYRLEYSSDFKQYDRITDELILNKFK
jgi:hypothetical protein